MTVLDARTVAEVDALLALFGPVRLRFCPLTPTPRQEAFLLLPDFEVFFGGAAAGGKSIGLQMAAAQYADVPGYHALILRPSLKELHLAGGLIALSHEWFAGTGARWSQDAHRWTFPSGATLTFGYLADEGDLSRYHGASYSFLGFDELAQFDETLYRRMFRVLRQPSATDAMAAAPDGTRVSDVPVRVRSTSNPGGAGHAWVKDRFVDESTRHPGVVYLPSRITDNPHLDRDTYLETLAHLPTAERMRLMDGDWNVPDDGELFQREWFQIIEPHQLPDWKELSLARYWDLAATAPSAANRDPDWTVGLLIGFHRKTGNYYIVDIVRERKGPGEIERLVKKTAERDGSKVLTVIEQDPGAAGKYAAERYTKHVLHGHRCKAVPVSGDKATRARNAAADAHNSAIYIVRCRHMHDFLDELTAFPHAKHDDCVDALSGAHHHATTSRRPGRINIPKGRLPTPHGHPENQHPFHPPRDIAGEQLAAMLGARYDPPPPPGYDRRRG